ncbi:MAG TPA: AAA family ATPase [Kofleriaceae bacterium]|jgi:tetratricopeptide (TPR) repeat protein
MLREAAATSTPDPLSFTGTERFEVAKYLGRGGFGSVYEVRDRQLATSDATLALKLLRRPRAEALARFKREFRDLAELRHPNLVTLYELVATEEHVFFTMELVRGSSPLVYVRRRPERARILLRRLAEGLGALHREGRLHRDVKPSNILVEPDGRVVLLDFGLAAEIGAVGDEAGTPLYMSPEQCAHERLTEASDFYAVGLVIFQALTGRLPFEGELADVMRAKQTTDAPRLSSLVDVPPDLDDLCAALLARDPAQRPRGDELTIATARVSTGNLAVLREVFVGRTAEQEALAQLFDEASRGECRVASVLGPSGIGKSALLRRFLDDVRHRHPETLILTGRCFELESVPYKALDAVIDELARQLRRMRDDEVAELFPKDADALATLFPVLLQVRCIASWMQIPLIASGARRLDPDKGDLKTRGLAALKTVLRLLSKKRPVVVCVDDLQWGDVDSANLFGDLVRGPDAPSVFWVSGFRDVERGTSPYLSRLAQVLEGTRLHELRLQPLAHTEAAILATELLGETTRADDRATTIATESQGNPFFVHELARTGGGVDALETIVQARVAQLDEGARSALELIAVAARPLELELVAGAAQIGDLRGALSTLRAERLIRAREGHHERLIECYHDRIREAVTRGLAPDRRRSTHLALATVLLRNENDANAAQIAWHLAEGGESARAYQYYRAAAERAASALAFDDAAQLYRRALDVGDRHSDHTALELAYAEALSASGHGHDAARVWMTLASRVDRERSVDLRRRATEELILFGDVRLGYAAMTDLLAELDITLARNPVLAVASIVAGRAALAISRHQLRTRAEPASKRELLRVDTLAGLSWAIAQMEPLTGYALQTEHLRLALQSGDRERAAVALWLEAILGALRGGRGGGKMNPTLVAARAMSAGLDEAAVPVAVTRMVEGIVAVFEGQFDEALVHLNAAEHAPRTRVLGHGSSRGTLHVFQSVAQFWMGRSGDLLRDVPARRREVDEQGNLYARLWLDLLEGWALSSMGRVAEAWAITQKVRARLPPDVFQIHRWYLEYGQIKFLLFEGNAEEAWHRLVEVRRQTRFKLTGQTQRVAAQWVRAATALLRADTNRRARREMLAEARTAVTKLEGERSPWIDAIATTLRAGIASVEGDTTTALRLFGQAEPMLARHHIEVVHAAVQRARGRLLGGAKGKELIARGDAWMASQSVDASISSVLLGVR